MSVLGSSFLPELQKDIILEMIPTLVPGGVYNTSEPFDFRTMSGEPLCEIPPDDVTKMYPLEDVSLRSPRTIRKNNSVKNPMHKDDAYSPQSSPSAVDKLKYREKKSNWFCCCCFRRNSPPPTSFDTRDDKTQFVHQVFHKHGSKNSSKIVILLYFF